MTPGQQHRYGSLVHAVNAHAASSIGRGKSAEAAAKLIARAITARRPRTRYTVGRDAAVLARVTRLLPDRALDFATAATLKTPPSERPVGSAVA
jgi:hypothetical protein